MKKSLLNICGQDFFVKILDWIFGSLAKPCVDFYHG